MKLRPRPRQARNFGGLDAFELYPAMGFKTFREKCQNTLDVFLSPPECAGVVAAFDADGDGEVSTVEFKRAFFAFQREAALERMLRQRQMNADKQAAAEAAARAHERRMLANQVGTFVPWQPQLD